MPDGVGQSALVGRQLTGLDGGEDRRHPNAFVEDAAELSVFGGLHAGVMQRKPTVGQSVCTSRRRVTQRFKVRRRSYASC